MTSHDVVAFARRTLGQPRIGHTGTLDPFATGVLPLACGRATRLARFMTASRKVYEATILFGLATDSYDVTGTEVLRTDARPAGTDVLNVLQAMRGEQLQQPPQFSAKRIGGRRAYDLAREQKPVVLSPVPVRLDHIEILGLTDDRAVVRLTCSAGFYVRSLAHDLGVRLGVGACLETLRRTRSGDFTLDQAVTIAAIDAGGGASALVGLADLLPDRPGVVVTSLGRDRLKHGQPLRGADVARELPPNPAAVPAEGDPEWVRILDESAALIGVGTRQVPGGALHPAIVLI